jgi:hypothetical protein
MELYLALVLGEKCAGDDNVLYRRGLEGNIKGNCGRGEEIRRDKMRSKQ